MKKTSLQIVTTLSTLLIAFSCVPMHTNAAEKIHATPSFTTSTDVESYKFYGLDAIYEAGGTRAACMDDIQSCSIRIGTSENPYDVDWDFGSCWNAYVDVCDWSLVFDAAYYKKTFPMLALQYNYDDELLLKHFQTVGVHEGRQGSASFNVEAYLSNCAPGLAKKYTDRVECAYLYYMLHYDTESKVNTTKCSDGSKPNIQLSNCLTAVQEIELKKANAYREDAGSNPVSVSAELNALANYRAYINRVSGLNETKNSGHDWARKNSSVLLQYGSMVDANMKSMAENTVTSESSYVKNYYSLYRNSKEHYAAMVDPKNDYIGVSNSYYYNSKASQFDMFINV